jgi:hypothetical protein
MGNNPADAAGGDLSACASVDLRELAVVGAIVRLAEEMGRE